MNQTNVRSNDTTRSTCLLQLLSTIRHQLVECAKLKTLINLREVIPHTPETWNVYVNQSSRHIRFSRGVEIPWHCFESAPRDLEHVAPGLVGVM